MRGGGGGGPLGGPEDRVPPPRASFCGAGTPPLAPLWGRDPSLCVVRWGRALPAAPLWGWAPPRAALCGTGTLLQHPCGVGTPPPQQPLWGTGCPPSQIHSPLWGRDLHRDTVLCRERPVPAVPSTDSCRAGPAQGDRGVPSGWLAAACGAERTARWRG